MNDRLRELKIYTVPDGGLDLSGSGLLPHEGSDVNIGVTTNSADERSLNVLTIKMVQMQADLFLRFRTMGQSPKDSEFSAMKEVISWIKLAQQG